MFSARAGYAGRMFMERKMGRHAFRFSIEGEMTVPLVGELKEAILPVIAHDREIEIDLSQVSEIDRAGLLLMVAMKLEAITGGGDLYFTGHSGPVMEMLGLCDFGHLLDAPAVAMFSGRGAMRRGVGNARFAG